MLWFIPHMHFNFIPVSKFKYILCYGSSWEDTGGKSLLANLNTSYVMVHLLKQLEKKILKSFKYILCYGSSLRFYILCDRVHRFKYILCYGSSYRMQLQRKRRKPFKYILCYGSSVKRLAAAAGSDNLNTSYVMVHPEFCLQVWHAADI